MKTKKVKLGDNEFNLNYAIENDEVVTKSVVGEDGKDHLDNWEQTDDFKNCLNEIRIDENLPLVPDESHQKSKGKKKDAE